MKVGEETRAARAEEEEDDNNKQVAERESERNERGENTRHLR